MVFREADLATHSVLLQVLVVEAQGPLADATDISHHDVHHDGGSRGGTEGAEVWPGNGTYYLASLLTNYALPSEY